MQITDLIEFLTRDIDLSNTSEQVKVTYRFTRFFNNLNPFHVMLLDNIVGACLSGDKEAANDLFKDFLDNNPEVSFNKEGNSPITTISHGDVQLYAIDELFKIASNKITTPEATLADYQVYYAKTLIPLKDIQGSDNYYMHRKIVLQKFPELNINDFKSAETILKDIFGKNRIMPKVIGYIEYSKYTSFSIFLDHFFVRVKALGEDKNLTKSTNKEFYDNLAKI